MATVIESNNNEQKKYIEICSTDKEHAVLGISLITSFNMLLIIGNKIVVISNQILWRGTEWQLWHYDNDYSCSHNSSFY